MPNRISYVAESEEPVSVDEAKLATRFDADGADALVEGYIATAREHAEHITGRIYRPQVLREELADWPAAVDAIAVHQATACVVKYWTGAGFATLDSSAYVFAPGGIGNNGTALAPVAGASWPALADRPIGPRVRIDLTAGPAAPTDVPASVKTFIAAHVAAWLNSPEALADKDLQASPLMVRLLDGERLWC